MIGEVAYGRADISICGIVAERTRLKVASPSVSYGQEYVQIYVPGPSLLPSFFALLRPLDSWTWSSIAIVVILAIVFKELFMKYFYKIHGFNLYPSAIFNSVYIIFGTYLIMTNVLSTAYTCNFQV